MLVQKFWKTNKEYYSIFLKWPVAPVMALSKPQISLPCSPAVNQSVRWISCAFPTCILAFFSIFKTPSRFKHISCNWHFVEGQHQPIITSINFNVAETKSGIKISDLKEISVQKRVSDYFQLLNLMRFIREKLLSIMLIQMDKWLLRSKVFEVKRHLTISCRGH